MDKIYTEEHDGVVEFHDQNFEDAVQEEMLRILRDGEFKSEDNNKK